MRDKNAPQKGEATPKASETSSQRPSYSFAGIAFGVLVFVAFLILCQNTCERLGAESTVPVVGISLLIALTAIVILAAKYNVLAPILTSVRLTVVLLTYLALACIVSTFVLQQPGQLPRDQEPETGRYQNYLNAQAPFVYKICHPFRRFAVTLKPVYESYTEILG